MAVIRGRGEIRLGSMLIATVEDMEITVISPPATSAPAAIASLPDASGTFTGYFDKSGFCALMEPALTWLDNFRFRMNEITGN